MLLKIILLLFSAISAFWISTICGGGASLILIPILNLIIPTNLVPFSLTVGTATSSTTRIIAFKNHVNWHIFKWFVPFSIPSVFIGAWLLKYLDPVYLQLLVGLLLISNLPQIFKKENLNTKITPPPSNFILAIIGLLAGFVSGITGAIGLLFNRFYFNYGLTKEEIIATRAANEIVLHIIKLIMYITLGVFSKEALLIGILIAISSIFSTYTIKYILPFLKDSIFKKVGYIAMVISGFFLFSNSSKAIVNKDNIGLSTINNGDEKETEIRWNDQIIVLKYSFKDGVKFEKPIQHTELPKYLQEEYKLLLSNYDKINLEKIYKIGEISYEFYCIKDKIQTKLKYENN